MSATIIAQTQFVIIVTWLGQSPQISLEAAARTLAATTHPKLAVHLD
jgi:hypothetical protein